MLKLLGGGGGNGDGKTRWQGKSFQIEQYNVTVEDILAEGGFALVFLVKGKRSQKYALKRMAVNNEQDLYIVRQEIAVTKALSDSPQSVTYLASSILKISPDVYEVLILLELYTGGRVVDMMNAKLKTGFSEEEVMTIFTDVCQAVARLHHRTKPIIHRDLKIENILRDCHGNFVLCDYGSCTIKIMHPEVLGAALCEEQIAKFTTMPYRAPEMVSLYSGNTITTKADIWALGCLLYKLCFFTTPFGEQPLAIVSGTFIIPDNSKYSDSVHSLIRYMLEPDADKRPNIWQVAEVAFGIRRLKNPTGNVFHSQPPPATLPSAPRSQTDKTKPTTHSKTKALPLPKEKATSSPQTTHATDSKVGKVQQLKTTVAILPRGRPRAHRAPSPNFTPTYLPSHLQPPQCGSAAMATSLDSGLNRFGPAGREKPVAPLTSRDLEQQQIIQRQQHQRARSAEQKCKSVYGELDRDKTEKLDQFGQPYFATNKPASVLHCSAGESKRDEFGHTPFVTLSNRSSPLSHSRSSNHPDSSDAVDEFGALRLSTSQHSSSSDTSRAPRDVFGAQPFIPSTDAFGDTPFVTS